MRYPVAIEPGTETEAFGVVQTGIAVDQDVSEGDELSLSRHLRGKHRIDPGQLTQGLTHVLKLPLDGRANERVILVSVEVDTSDKPSDRVAGFGDVPQARARHPLHAWKTSLRSRSIEALM